MKKQKLIDLYKQMLYIRRVEERISDEYQYHLIRCPTHLAVGQEAIAVGVCAHLTMQDIVFSTHRSHAHYLAKGASLNEFIAELYGKSTGCAGGFGGSQHLLDKKVNFWGSTPIVGSTIPVAVGAAFSVMRKKEKRIVVVFFGDAATEEGVFSESINFAALHKLPILFICENNGYSTNTPIRERQPVRPIYQIAKALGAGAMQSDGNSILSVIQSSRKAIKAIKSAQGPQFIEYHTYRTLQHCGPKEDPPGYRPEKEKQYWHKRDPLTLFEKSYKFLTVSEKQKIELDLKNIIDDAFDFAQKSPDADVHLSEKLVYAKHS